MSDPDAAPDPVDRAYVEAEAVLSDEAARAARRGRVLAAVATQGASTPPAPATRAPLWRRGGWLVAACVSGLALFIASQIYEPPPPPPSRPAAPPVHPAPAVKAAGAAPAPPALAQVPARPVLPRPARPELSEPPILYEPAPLASGPERGAPDSAVAGRIAPPRVASPLAQSKAPAPVAPPPPPPPPPAAAAASPGRAASLAGNAETQEVVVTAEKREEHLERVPIAVSAFTAAARDVSDPGARLRAAAAAGRTAEVDALLEQGAPVDAPDADGNTALMQSIRSDHAAAAAALRRHGASLDHKNQAGESARDMARSLDDAKLNRAIGLGP